MKILNAGENKGYGNDANWNVKYNNGQFYSFTPNSTFKIYHLEYENTVHINQLGARATEINNFTDTNKIIPFIGDSYVMGVGVEDTETMVSVLKKSLQYNFLNLGVAGTSLPIQRLIIKNRYSELGMPSVAIYGFLLDNDFDDILKLKAKNSADSTLLAKENSPDSTSETSIGWKINYFINHSWLRKLYSLQYLKQKILNIKNRGKAKHMEAIFSIINTENISYIQKAEQEIDKEVELLSKEPYKSIVLIIPDRAQIDSSLRNNMCDYYGLNKEKIDPFLPNKIIINSLKKYNIKYIDATECLIKHQKEGSLYYTKDKHFTKFGHHVFSKCVEHDLREALKKLNLKR